MYTDGSMFQEDERTRPRAEESGCGKSILMVEVDDTIGAFLVLALRQETPYVVHWVSDGFEALRAIREDKPDLLILDYQLPRMNGIDLYDKIHALPGFEHIPVIMMSVQLPKREIEKRTLVGISKPFELGELFDTLEQFLA
jgi:DNA-binding response OmpR family regulator